MKTTTPTEEAAKMRILEAEEMMPCSMEIPLQQMFDEFMVFISKADFE